MGDAPFEYPEEIEEIRRGITAFVQREVIPRHEANAAAFDHSRFYGPDGRQSPAVRTLVKEVREASARAGYYTMCVPEHLGGSGLGHLAYFGAWERIYHLCGGQYYLGQHVVAHWAMGPSPLFLNLTDRAAEEMLAPLMSGEASMCFGLSEPGAGSDATMISTRARPDGDGWRITGAKIWTTNGPYADYAIIFAITDPEAAAARKGGISAFLTRTDAPGFGMDQVVRMWGHAGGEEAMFTFDELRVEPHQLVGKLGRGFETAMVGVNLGRIYNTARSVGLSRWALEKAFDYVKVRKAFGRTLSEYQAVTFPLADSLTEIHATRLMAVNVARMLDAGLPARKELSMTKGFAVRAGVRAIDNAIQAHGAMGVTNELYLTPAYIALRNVNIADGSNEILRRAIVKEVLAGDTEV